MDLKKSINSRIIIILVICAFVNFKLISAQDTAEETCQYRNIVLTPSFFQYYADWGCYNYTREGMFVSKLEPCPPNTNPIVPGIKHNGTCQPFHHSNPFINQTIRKTFINERAYERWINCYEEAESCCNKILVKKPEIEGKCTPLWDGWTCYADYTPAGETRELPCSTFAYTNNGPRCTHYSYKECFPNATWNIQTDYSTCSITPRLISRTNWHIGMLSFSLAACAPALFIFLWYKQLRSQKYYMIRNLIIAIVARNIFVLMSKSILILDELTSSSETAMSRNETPCKVLTFFEKLSANAVFTCMLLEGIYLHQLLTNAFASRRNSGPNMLIYYIAGAVISTATAVTWAILISMHSDQHCWVVTDDTSFHWINDSPRILMLLINTGLLCHIVIVMWQTFRSKSSENNPALRTARASLICLPLFGIPFLFLVFRPDTDSCTAEQIYYFISYAMEGLQGVFVVIFYCYTDREVMRLLKRSYFQVRDRVNIPASRTTVTRSRNSERRTTFSTFADGPQKEDDENDNPNSIDNDNRKLSVIHDVPIAIVKNNSEMYPSVDEPIYQNVPQIRRKTAVANENWVRSTDSFPTIQNFTDTRFEDFGEIVEPIEKDLPKHNTNDEDLNELNVNALFRNRGQGIVVLNDVNNNENDDEVKTQNTNA